MKFEIGDRVMVKGEKILQLHNAHNKRYKGRVINIELMGYYNTVIISVEFDVFINGHCGGGVGKQGHCWIFKCGDIIPLKSLVAFNSFKHKLIG